MSVPFVPHVCFKAGVKSTSFKSNSRYCVDRKSVWRIFFKFRVNAALVLKRLKIPVGIICVQTEKKKDSLIIRQIFSPLSLDSCRRKMNHFFINSGRNVSNY